MSEGVRNVAEIKQYSKSNKFEKNFNNSEGNRKVILDHKSQKYKCYTQDHVLYFWIVFQSGNKGEFKGKDKHPVKSFVCDYFKNLGYCKNGDNCRFFHESNKNDLPTPNTKPRVKDQDRSFKAENQKESIVPKSEENKKGKHLFATMLNEL